MSWLRSALLMGTRRTTTVRRQCSRAEPSWIREKARRRLTSRCLRAGQMVEDALRRRTRRVWSTSPLSTSTAKRPSATWHRVMNSWWRGRCLPLRFRTSMQVGYPTDAWPWSTTHGVGVRQAVALAHRPPCDPRGLRHVTHLDVPCVVGRAGANPTGIDGARSYRLVARRAAT